MNQQLFKHIPFQFTVDLYQGLVAARRFQLQPALSAAINAVGVLKIDADLQRLVPEPALNLLARLGLRGERVFPTPSIIIHAPPLIGYYRMLLGISKKNLVKLIVWGMAHGSMQKKPANLRHDYYHWLIYSVQRSLHHYRKL